MNNDISLLNGDKAKYNEMKDAINRVIRTLEYAIEEISSASRQIATNNCINEERADGNKVEAYKNNLVNQVNWLKNTILPAIDESISSCNSQINDIMSAIAAATVVTKPTISASVGSVVQTQSKSTSTATNKGTVTTSKITSSTKISSSTSINKTKSTTVSKSTANAAKKITTSILNSLKGLFK